MIDCTPHHRLPCLYPNVDLFCLYHSFGDHSSLMLEVVLVSIKRQFYATPIVLVLIKRQFYATPNLLLVLWILLVLELIFSLLN